LSNEKRGLPEYFNVVKSIGGRGSARTLLGGSLQLSPDPLAGEEGADCPSPRTSPPLSALWASNLMAFGHSFYAPKLKY